MEELPKKERSQYRTETKAEEEAQLHPRDFDVLPEVRERREIRQQDRPDRLLRGRGGRS